MVLIDIIIYPNIVSLCIVVGRTTLLQLTVCIYQVVEYKSKTANTYRELTRRERALVYTPYC
jgi:hypothetical protein